MKGKEGEAAITNNENEMKIDEYRKFKFLNID